MSDKADIKARTLAAMKSLEEESLEVGGQTKKSWDKFSQWLCCMCVVTFDLELGQAMEV